MNDAWPPQWMKTLSDLRDDEEKWTFLKVLLTPQEIEEFEKRWQILQLLDEGYPQREVRQMVGVSIATVSRGAKELRNASEMLQKFLFNYVTDTRCDRVA